MISPGIHTNISERDYHAIKAADLCSQSYLKKMRKSPKHAMYAEASHQDSASMMLGRAVHCLTLTPSLFDDGFTAYEGKVRRGKAYDAFVAESGGKEILTQSEMTSAQRMASAVAQHQTASKLFVGGKAEVTIVASINGVACKIRLDYLIEHDDHVQIIDLKSTKDASPEAFSRDSWNFGYHWQSGLYSEITAGEFNGKPVLFSIVAVESSLPHDVVVYDVPQELTDFGFQRCLEQIAKFDECKSSGNYPGISDVPLELGVPSWAHKDVYGE